ncbi:MAG TPA: group 1 truncated hemoglobin [Polyangiales bacterium]
MSTASLYQRVGGENAILAAATLFYDKVLSDPELAPFFADLDMEQQVRKQVAFMSWAFGGPERYQYRPLREAHAGVREQGLNGSHFDRVAQHLTATLQELGLEPELISEAMGIVASTRAQVVGA